MRTFVVVNPASANGRTGRRWPELSQRLRAKLGDFEHAFTQRPRQGADLARAALCGGARRVVSVGGDGTHNEVVNGFFDGDTPIDGDAELALVPTGTGGDLRRTLGLPNDALQAIDLVGEESRRVDVGKLVYTAHHGGEETSYFINIASFGVSGLVDRYVNASSKALGGKTSFLLGVAKAAVRYRNQSVRLRLDDGPAMERTLYNGVIANGRYFGGGMKVAPDALMNDGAFDVVLMGDLGMVELARGLPKLYRGDHLKMGSSRIEVYRAKVVHAEPVTPGMEVLIDMDGEQPGRLPARFELISGALRVAVGPRSQVPAER